MTYVMKQPKTPGYTPDFSGEFLPPKSGHALFSTICRKIELLHMQYTMCGETPK